MKKAITLVTLASQLCLGNNTHKLHTGEYHNLYAPWRDRYYQSKAETDKKPNQGFPTCIFCTKLNEYTDKKHFFIRRFQHTVVALNLYPYNEGHLLILPLQHHATLADLDKEGRMEIMQLIIEGTQILQETMHATGINIGINVGLNAGASIPDHLHIHLIPRWMNDTSFLRIMTGTNVVQCDLNKLYARLKEAFDQVTIN